MPIFTITCWTFESDLARMSHDPRLMRDKFYLGLPFRMHDPDNIQSRNYVVLEFKRFFNPHLNREAARLEGLVTRSVFGNPDRNAGWDELMRHPEIRHLRQNSTLSEAWGLMLLRIILRERPRSYLYGGQHMADFFAERFQLEFDTPGARAIFHKQLLERAYLEAALDLKVELAFEHEQRLTQLENLAGLGEVYAQVMVVLMGCVSGVSEILVIEIILAIFINFITFMNDLRQMEADGLITEEEAFGSWIGLVGVFIPFFGGLKGVIGRAIHTVTSVAALVLMLLQLLRSLVCLAIWLLDFLAADEAGFESFGAYDPNTTIFIEA